MTILLSRRRLFGIGASLLAAPAIVRVSSIMPVSVFGGQIGGPMTAAEVLRLREAWLKTVEDTIWRNINPPLVVDEFGAVVGRMLLPAADKWFTLVMNIPQETVGWSKK